MRNVGNTPNTLNITLQGYRRWNTVDHSCGQIQHERLGGGPVRWHRRTSCSSQMNREIEIGFQSPNEFSGEIHVELKVFATGAQSLLEVPSSKASIVRPQCNDGRRTMRTVAPKPILQRFNQRANTGNAYDTVVLRTGALTDGFDVTIPPMHCFCKQTNAESFNSRRFAAPDALAFKLGMLELELVGDAGVVLATAKRRSRLLLKSTGVFETSKNQVDAFKADLPLRWKFDNEGNAVDGLVVQLRSSHTVNMGFIPPEVAVFEDGVEYPRSFEINDIPLNSNFTIRAWADLPTDQSSNGTVYINTTIRSRFAPELPFVHTSTGDYLGVMAYQRRDG